LNLKVVSHNCRSATANLDKLVHSLIKHDFSPNILLLQETWGWSGKLNPALNPRDWNVVGHFGQKHQGVAMIVLKGIQFKTVIKTRNLLAIEISTGSRYCIVATCYVPPQSADTVFHIWAAMAGLINRYRDPAWALMGDINAVGVTRKGQFPTYKLEHQANPLGVKRGSTSANIDILWTSLHFKKNRFQKYFLKGQDHEVYTLECVVEGIRSERTSKISQEQTRLAWNTLIRNTFQNPQLFDSQEDPHLQIGAIMVPKNATKFSASTYDISRLPTKERIEIYRSLRQQGICWSTSSSWTDDPGPLPFAEEEYLSRKNEQPRAVLVKQAWGLEEAYRMDMKKAYKLCVESKKTPLIDRVT